VPHGPPVVPSTRGGVTFQHALVIGGQVAGTWRMTRSTDRTAIDVIPLRRLTLGERGQIGLAAERYSRFLAMPVSLKISPWSSASPIRPGLR
jgi:hypothetical protein